MTLREVGQFCHVIDDDGRLDLTDVAFMIIMIKVACAHALDWPAVVTLATVLLNKIHKRSTSLEEDPSVAQMTQQVKALNDKIAPVVDKIKGL